MNKSTNYDRFPTKKIYGRDGCAKKGWNDICQKLSAETTAKSKAIIVADCYPGVDTEWVKSGLSGINFSHVFCSDECALPSDALDDILKESLTDDRVFGRMTEMDIRECFSEKALSKMRSEVKDIEEGTVLVYGVGAALVCRGDILIVADIDRWEIQLRYRNGMSNWNTQNSDAPFLSKYKRGYFIEWRWADKHKVPLLSDMDFLLDANRPDDPVLVTGDGIRDGLSHLSKEPFRTVPYFDPGVWGGQWMKEVCALDKNQKNFAWSFDGVPEENSLRMQFGDITAEMPAMNLIKTHPTELLGEYIYKNFGAEFPIRFDFLDTMGGENLSLQVHPLKNYIKEKFNMPYTQDESYYFLDAGEDACVYLGLKNDVDKNEMIESLYSAQRGEKPFDAESFVNRFPVKKHDHVLIPAGTVHCSGKNGMVLEISATPYIFTFKLWDWGRLGLDGLPRPIHIEHGKENIQWNRNTDWVKKNLLHRETTISETENAVVEKTGLHELEFIETFRYTIKDETALNKTDKLCVCNLVDGKEAIIKSPENKFEPFVVHYAETFILPAACGDCTISAYGKSKGKAVKIIVATVKQEN